MRLSVEWLNEFIALPKDLTELCHRLDMGGFEDVAIESTGPELEGVVVGFVKEREQHPNADRLSLCRVDVGGEALLEIVCGAPNVEAGQKVAVAPVGTTLPDGTRLKKSKIRGVVSQGMICSTRELGLGEDGLDGILVLAADAPVGVPLTQVVPTGDRIIEVGITPNRGDTASLLGLAREVRALCGGEISLPDSQPSESGAAAASAVSIAIEAGDVCHRYVGRLLRGVTVGPSPDWIVRRLEASGVRAINCVVDVANLVMLELGQPLHAFDYDTLHGAEVSVRRARQGEKLATLDGQTRSLDAADLVIADADRAIALAGVMGGSDTEVGDTTRNILIESAHFDPVSVRLCARRHGLHSEASYRFERGVDRNGIEHAADRAALLIAEIAGGEVAPGAVIAEGKPPEVTDEIGVDVARANRLLGTSLTADAVEALLGRVGIESRQEPAGVVVGRIPSHRNDLHVHQDLTEEIARIFGYDEIPATLPRAELLSAQIPRSWVLADQARDSLAASGLQEVVSLPFLGAEDLERLGLASDDLRARAVVIANPIHEGEGLMRTTLLPSLLKLARQNRNRQLDRVGIFEVSRAFIPRGEGELPDEALWATAVLVATQDRGLWENPTPIFYEARGFAERLLIQAGYVASFQRDEIPPYLHPGASAVLEVGARRVGSVGELHPEVSAGFEIDAPCAVVEVNLSALENLTTRKPVAEEISRQPRVTRDIAVLLDRNQPAGDVLTAIEKAAGRDLASAEIFDRYEGKGVPEDRVSLAFRLVFQRADRTLKDTEVAKAIERVVRMISHRFGGELR